MEQTQGQGKGETPQWQRPQGDPTTVQTQAEGRGRPHDVTDPGRGGDSTTAQTRSKGEGDPTTAQTRAAGRETPHGTDLGRGRPHNGSWTPGSCSIFEPEHAPPSALLGW